MHIAIEIGLFVAGLVLGVLINLAIYSLAYFPRAISPWQRRDPDLPPRGFFAYLPVVGWLGRRGETSKWGRGFWIRPLLIELLVPFLWIALYRAMMAGLTIPTSIRVPAAGIATGGGVTAWELHIQFLAYSFVLFLLTVATFIDIDELCIPDWITVPGTCIGVLASALLPGWTLWDVPSTSPSTMVRVLEPLHCNSPNAWDIRWGQVGEIGPGLWIGCLIWWLWCLSLGNLQWIPRRGIRKAFEYAWVGFWRSPNLGIVFGMGIVGMILLAIGYAWLPPQRWQQLFSSLMGIALGGVLIWSFRIVGAGVLRTEVLGFGDVTLMAMVGAHFGWQIVLCAFFLAPICGLVLVIAYWVITRDSRIWFGPFLAIATAYLMLDWARVWDVVSVFFIPLELFFIGLFGILVLFGSLLWLVRTLKVFLMGGEQGR